MGDGTVPPIAISPVTGSLRQRHAAERCRPELLVCFNRESVVSSSATHGADGAPRNRHSTGL